MLHSFFSKNVPIIQGSAHIIQQIYFLPSCLCAVLSKRLSGMMEMLKQPQKQLANVVIEHLKCSGYCKPKNLIFNVISF